MVSSQSLSTAEPLIPHLRTKNSKCFCLRLMSCRSRTGFGGTVPAGLGNLVLDKSKTIIQDSLTWGMMVWPCSEHQQHPTSLPQSSQDDGKLVVNKKRAAEDRLCTSVWFFKQMPIDNHFSRNMDWHQEKQCAPSTWLAFSFHTFGSQKPQDGARELEMSQQLPK